MSTQPGWPSSCSTAGDRIYGLGEKTGFLEKSGRLYQMWNTDEPLHLPTRDPLYQSIPFFLQATESGVIGHFYDCPVRSWFDFREHDPVCERSTPSVYRVTVEQPYLDCWLLFGETASEVASELRARQIPCDVIYLDIHYMEGYRVFTWNAEGFPHPAALTAELLDRGFRTVTIIDPGVKADPGYRVFSQAARDGHFVRRADGSIYIGRVWPGDSAFPDFSRAATRSYWADQHDVLFDEGVSGIWNDMNEPAGTRDNDACRDLMPPVPIKGALLSPIRRWSPTGRKRRSPRRC